MKINHFVFWQVYIFHAILAVSLHSGTEGLSKDVSFCRQHRQLICIRQTAPLLGMMRNFFSLYYYYCLLLLVYYSSNTNILIVDYSDYVLYVHEVYL